MLYALKAQNALLVLKEPILVEIPLIWPDFGLISAILVLNHAILDEI